jgi:cell division protein FtsN
MGKKVKEKETLPKKSKSYFSRKRLAIWICLILFVSAWMFILGILVGRGTAPVKFDIEKLQNELAALKEDVVKKELERFKIDSNASDNKAEMNFYEELKITKDEDSLNIDTSKQNKKPLHENIVSESKKIGPSEEALSVNAHQESKPETENNTDKTIRNLTIQVASFKDPNVADKMVAKLKEKGYPAYRSMGKIPGKGLWYRVRIGYYGSKSEADGTIKKLKKDQLDCILVNR